MITRKILSALSILAITFAASQTHTHAAATAEPGVIVVSSKDQSLLDTSGDGSGNLRGSVHAVEGRVGENKVDGDEVRYCLPFRINDDEAAAMLAAPDVHGQITLNILLLQKLNTKKCKASITGLGSRSDETISLDDYHAQGRMLHPSAFTDSNRGGKVVSLDVTSFVRDELKRGARVIAFRVQMHPAPPADGVVNRFTLATAESKHPAFLRFQR